MRRLDHFTIAMADARIRSDGLKVGELTDRECDRIVAAAVRLRDAVDRQQALELEDDEYDAGTEEEAPPTS